MCDQWGSAAWIFDRCQEFGTDSPYLVWLLVVLVARITLGASSRAQLSTELALVYVTISMLITYFVTPVIIMVVGYGVVGCSAAGQFWPAVVEGHQLHDLIKTYYQEHGRYPDSLESISQLFSSEYLSITSMAKIAYESNSGGLGYTLWVRPSRYLVAVYDSQLDFGIYYLDHLGWFRPGFAASFPSYPPTSDRHWPSPPN